MQLNLNHLPTFETTLPITKQKVKYRPFVMKEEKILLMAAESNDKSDVISALETTIKGCSFDVVSCDTHPMLDIQYLFLQIRGKSVGEEIDFSLVCGNCSHEISSKININDIVIKYDPTHTNKIKISEHLFVTMGYPKMSHLAELYAESTETEIDGVYNVIADCIEQIESNDEVFTKGDTLAPEDTRSFIDNLTSAQFEALKEFFDTMPVINHTITFTCIKCDKVNNILIEELVNFFE